MFIQRNKKINKECGFTMIEMIVSVAVFFLIIGIVSNIFVSTLRGQARTLAFQELLDQVGFTTEYMGRSIRMAVKATDTSCLSSAGLNYQKTNTGGGGGIKFLDYDGNCIEFYLDSNANTLKKKKNSEPSLSLTSPSLEVISFNIGPSGTWDDADLEQPRITMFLEVRGTRGAKLENQPIVKIQTMISQRNPDFPGF